ncbi:hypothetical protein F5Y03DRAFT_402562 [Xylaria venustula]|nr:hypothetical protein F5Y03DRAFT_402562 [Xylaria venustula]
MPPPLVRRIFVVGPRGVEVIATRDVFHARPGSGPTQGQIIVIITVIAVASFIIVCVVICYIRRVYRRCINSHRISEVEEDPDDEPIPLQNLQPAEDQVSTAASAAEPTGPSTVAPAAGAAAAPSVSTSGSSYEAELPGPTILRPPPPPRTVNETDEELNSRPPNEADVDVPANVLRDRTNQVRDIEPVAEAGPSTQQLPEEEPAVPEQAPTPPPRSRLRRSSATHSGLNIPGSRQGGVWDYLHEEGLMPPAIPEHATTSGTQSQTQTTTEPGFLPVGFVNVSHGGSDPDSVPAGLGSSGSATDEQRAQLSPASHENSPNDSPESLTQEGNTNNGGRRRSLPSRLHHLSHPGVNFLDSVSYGPFPAFENWMKKGNEVDGHGLDKDNRKLGKTNMFQPPQAIVPAPLAVPQRKTLPYPAASAPNSVAHVHEQVASPDISPAEPQMGTQRPTSFVLDDLPQEKGRGTGTFDDATRLNTQWWKPPTDERIERARVKQANRQWQQEAERFILQQAKEAGEGGLSKEELDRRVDRMRKRQSQALEFAMQAADLSLTPPNTSSGFDTGDDATLQSNPAGPSSSSPPGVPYASSQALPRAISRFAGTGESSHVASTSPHSSPAPDAHTSGSHSPTHGCSRFRRSQ